MTDFSRFKKTTTDSARFTFYDLEGEPWVTVKPASAANKPYLNSLLKGQRRRRRATADAFIRNRRQDIGLYAQHVVTAWGNVTDNAGTEVPFSVDNCKDFLAAIPDWLLDELRDFATDPESFTGEDDDGDDDTPKN